MVSYRDRDEIAALRLRVEAIEKRLYTNPPARKRRFGVWVPSNHPFWFTIGLLAGVGVGCSGLLLGDAGVLGVGAVSSMVVIFGSIACLVGATEKPTGLLRHIPLIDRVEDDNTR